MLAHIFFTSTCSLIYDVRKLSSFQPCLSKINTSSFVTFQKKCVFLQRNQKELIKPL